MDWFGFHRTLVGLTQLAELESHCKGEVIVLSEVKAVVLDSVYNLLGLIDQVIDFPASKECGSFCIKAGVDKELDDKKLQHAGLPDLLSAVAEEEAKNLPPGGKACTVCYIPHVGFLIAMPCKKTSEKTGESDQNIPNFEFIFES